MRWQAEQQRRADEANRKRAAAKVGNDNAAKMREPKTIVPQVVGSLNSTKRNVTNEAKAAASRTNRGAVERMDALRNKRPDLAEKVKVGELPAARRRMRSPRR